MEIIKHTLKHIAVAVAFCAAVYLLMLAFVLYASHQIERQAKILQGIEATARFNQ